jgi:hypothetical protein
VFDFVLTELKFLTLVVSFMALQSVSTSLAKTKETKQRLVIKIKSFINPPWIFDYIYPKVMPIFIELRVGFLVNEIM